ncbi:hypothetical protein PHYPSEUDO_010886 [Phytophthora pseudosyringae]|uniref:Myb-like DNA-binding protein n=1 Tax=Phytophthora pseudosyringae TaxID=221518 RepID=A0A8T1V9B2_9STRA|nr:hypothetical protein PHYPSEUDO_010886 [Phytophthora pseudosyringae]
MSISVSRESISKLMGELVEGFPMEGDGRASISDFGKLLFTEGQAAGSSSAAKPGQPEASSRPAVATPAANGAPAPTQTGSKRVFTEIKGVPRQKQHDIMKTKDKAVPKRWTQEEDEKLREAVGRHGERNWKSIAEEVPGRNHTQCLQRWTKVLAPGLVKGHWRPEEDDLLKELVAEGRKNWGQVATRIPGRTSKQCRERWYNHLDPSIIRGEYSTEEDRMILDAQARLGNRWSAIAAMLPGRTEDAVKIRWKSLCRVRKGQGRRGQADKGKMTPKGVMGMAGQMMQQGGPGFDGGMVKSEEVAAFSMHPQQQQGGAQMVRLPNGQMVPATSMQGGGQHHPAMMGAMAGNGMVYQSDMSGGGYDPTMAHYRKPPMQQHIVNDGYGHSLPPSGPMPGSNTQEYPVDRRSNMVSLPPNGMTAPSQSQDGYRQGYQGSSSGYPPPSSMNGGMYSAGSSTPSGSMNNGQMYGGAPHMNSYRSGGALYGGSQASPHQPQQMSHSPHPQMMSYSYGMPPAPSTTESMNGGASSRHPMHPSNSSMSSPAEAYAQRQQQQQSHQYVDCPVPIPHHMPHQRQHRHQHAPAQQHVPSHERDQPNPEKEPPMPQQQMKRPNEAQPKEEPRPGPMPTPSAQSPAAMFARSQAAKASPAATNSNPVAAFLQTQQQQKRKEQPSASSKMAQAGPQRPFNPAAAFAQRFQAGQKPPMPSSNAGSAKSNDDTADEDDDGENGSGDKTNEPSLKKVKPRLSIDAARASAARRLRSSGSGDNLAGRGSLDVFLNEIGDVGRLSDLKMDGFQTLEELWRVSGDMDRLSL